MPKYNNDYYGYKVKSVNFGRVVLSKKDAHNGESTSNMSVKDYFDKFNKKPVPGELVVQNWHKSRKYNFSAFIFCKKYCKNYKRYIIVIVIRLPKRGFADRQVLVLFWNV